MISRIKNKSIAILSSMLKEGMSLHKMALCLAMGVTLGIFPVLGIPTLLCTAAAFAFRLNLPAIQLVNYLVYPIQLVLLAPFYSAGSWLFTRQDWLTTGENLIHLLKNDFWGSITNLWNLTLYAIFIWIIICPFLILILYRILKPTIGAISPVHKRRPSE